MIYEGNSNKLVSSLFEKTQEEIESYLRMEHRISEREIIQSEIEVRKNMEIEEEKNNKAAKDYTMKEINRLGLQYRNEGLKEQFFLIEELFKKVVSELKDIRSLKNYETILHSWVKEGKKAVMSDDIVVEVDKEDVRLLKGLKEKIEIQESKRKLMGVIVKSKDLKRGFENTIEARVRRLGESIKEEIFQLVNKDIVKGDSNEK